ncbi:hypothetical protein BDP27DRAFT_411397 [Rhodocollybia butyracea]|uniref:DUF6533 domain-containing protein n=1 Tax=Rhodocollybia butyracea TaxID=206335 RepID=A0A9P5Q1I7_9AGAR|nr:hypothetical protein BDP27DRAFT_411397 [Rhodocollybia butyracea]
MADQLKRERLLFCFRSSSLVSQVLLVYDYSCTLNQELEFIWSKPLSVGSLLFFVNRYLPFLDTVGMSVILDFKSDMFTDAQCKRHFRLTAWLMFVGMLLSEVILTLRTSALWGRKPAVDISFVCLAIASAAPAIYFLHLEMSSLDFGSPFANPGCISAKSNNTIFIVFGILAFYEFVIAVFTAIKAHKHMRCTQSPWVVQIYREGLLFYVYMFVFSVINACIAGRNPELGAPLQTLQRVFHSILCNRVLFMIFNGPPAMEEYTEDPVLTSLEDEGYSNLGPSVYSTHLPRSIIPSETSSIISTLPVT